MDREKTDALVDAEVAADTSMISSTSPYQPTTEPVQHRRPFIAGFVIDMKYIKSYTGNRPAYR